MNTNEELKTRPDFEKLAYWDELFHFKTGAEDRAAIKAATHIWTTHVEPLQAKLDKSESENQKLRETIEAAFIAGRSKTSWEQFQKDNGLLKP